MRPVFARAGMPAMTAEQQSCNRVGGPWRRCYGSTVVQAQSTRPPLTAITRSAVAGVVAIAASLVAPLGAHAYPAPGYAGLLSAACTTVAQGQQCPVTFSLTQPGGQPAGGVPVAFTVSSCGGVVPATGTTGANGQVSTELSAQRP